MKKHNKKIIGIDARLYGSVGRGLGRYIKEVIDRIVDKIDNPLKGGEGKNKYVIFLGKDNFKEFKTTNPNAKKVLCKTRWYSIKEQIVMPFFILKEKIDLMHFPHFNIPIFCPSRFIVTIHDLILTKFPTLRATTLYSILYKIKNLGYKVVISTAVHRSEQIITVSNFTRKDIIKQFKISANKIIVTYEGITKTIKYNPIDNNEEKVLLWYNIKKPFLLYVGSAYPHKNLELLIKAFRNIRKRYPNLHLVLVGREDYFYQKLKQANKQTPCIVFTGYVPDKDLRILYKNALAYVFPSIYEGFGLPPLEAIINHCPVVSSNQASMPEILGKSALYFNPFKVKEIENKLKQIIDDENLRKDLVKTGLDYIKKYNWDKCAQQTFELYCKN